MHRDSLTCFARSHRCFTLMISNTMTRTIPSWPLRRPMRVLAMPMTLGKPFPSLAWLKQCRPSSHLSKLRESISSRRDRSLGDSYEALILKMEGMRWNFGSSYARTCPRRTERERGRTLNERQIWYDRHILQKCKDSADGANRDILDSCLGAEEIVLQLRKLEMPNDHNLGFGSRPEPWSNEAECWVNHSRRGRVYKFLFRKWRVCVFFFVKTIEKTKTRKSSLRACFHYKGEWQKWNLAGEVHDQLLTISLSSDRPERLLQLFHDEKHDSISQIILSCRAPDQPTHWWNIIFKACHDAQQLGAALTQRRSRSPGWISFHAMGS